MPKKTYMADEFIKKFNEIACETIIKSTFDTSDKDMDEYMEDCILPIVYLLKLINPSYIRLPDEVKEEVTANEFIDSVLKVMDNFVSNNDPRILKLRYDILFRKLAFKTGMWTSNIRLVESDEDGSNNEYNE